MAGGTPARQGAIGALVTAFTPEALAATIVDALAIAGELTEWDSETIEWVVGVLEDTARAAGLPSVDATVTDTDPYDIHPNTAYWRSVTGN